MNKLRNDGTTLNASVVRVMMVGEDSVTWSSKIFSLVPSPVAKQLSLHVTMRHLNGLRKARSMSAL